MARPEDREILRQSLDQHREELRLAVEDLRVATRSLHTPADVIRDRPIAALAIGFLLGLWLGRDRRVVLNG